jgi:hypothetical protein
VYDKKLFNAFSLLPIDQQMCNTTVLSHFLQQCPQDGIVAGNVEILHHKSPVVHFCGKKPTHHI